jgi:hypothetical protein
VCFAIGFMVIMALFWQVLFGAPQTASANHYAPYQDKAATDGAGTSQYLQHHTYPVTHNPSHSIHYQDQLDTGHCWTIICDVCVLVNTREKNFFAGGIITPASGATQRNSIASYC